MDKIDYTAHTCKDCGHTCFDSMVQCIREPDVLKEPQEPLISDPTIKENELELNKTDVKDQIWICFICRTIYEDHFEGMTVTDGCCIPIEKLFPYSPTYKLESMEKSLANSTEGLVVQGRKVRELQKENERLVLALKEIVKGEGAYNEDNMQHAINTIENMKQLAKEALEPITESEG